MSFGLSFPKGICCCRFACRIVFAFKVAKLENSRAMIMRKNAITFVAVLVLCGCQKAAEPKQSPVQSFGSPTALEAFDLQSRCDALGRKILEDNVIGSALAQEETSRYNPTDNHCYVRLVVHTADLTIPRENYTSDEFLKDGQSGELLATIYFKGQQGSAHVFDESLKKMVKDPFVPSPDEVGDLINKFMNTNRRP
jgi:hypothetical protein